MKDKLDKGGVNWKNVLHEIYTFAPHSYGIGKKGFSDDEHPLAKKLGISGEELMLSISFLQEHDLINFIHTGNKVLALKEKGFKVALENEKVEGEQLVQRGIGILTAIIAVTGGIDFIVKIHDSYSPFNLVVILIYSAFLLYIFSGFLTRLIKKEEREIVKTVQKRLKEFKEGKIKAVGEKEFRKLLKSKE